MKTMPLSPQTFVQAFKAKFGGDKSFYLKIDSENNPYTGEGANLPNGLPIFNPYHDEEMAECAREFGFKHKFTYNGGVNPDVDKFCESVGWIAEPYDAGTLKFYQH